MGSKIDTQNSRLIQQVLKSIGDFDEIGYDEMIDKKMSYVTKSGSKNVGIHTNVCWGYPCYITIPSLLLVDFLQDINW